MLTREGDSILKYFDLRNAKEKRCYFFEMWRKMVLKLPDGKIEFTLLLARMIQENRFEAL